MRCLTIGCLFAAILAGCGPSNTVPQPVVPVPVVQPIPARTDLPAGWVEVSGNGWSYGVPKDFDQIKSGLPQGLLARNYSVVKGLTITLSSQITANDLHVFVLNEFISNRQLMILQTGEKTNGPLSIMAVHSLLLPKMADGSLDFFAKKNDTIWHLTCSGANAKLVAQSGVCFEVADTLRLQ